MPDIKAAPAMENGNPKEEEIFYMMNMPKRFIEANDDEKIRLVKKFAADSSDRPLNEEDVVILTNSL